MVNVIGLLYRYGNRFFGDGISLVRHLHSPRLTVQLSSERRPDLGLLPVMLFAALPTKRLLVW